MAGSSKEKWQMYVSCNTSAIVQAEVSQEVSNNCFPTDVVAPWKPSTVHLFFALVLDFRMNGLRTVVNDKGEHCPGGTAL